MTGKYPFFTGAYMNHQAMDKDAITWGEILRDFGYETGYVGKWHLNGEEKPGFMSRDSFGFSETKYMYNRGHWKLFDENKNGEVLVYDWNDVDKKRFQDVNLEKHYTTDVLFREGTKFIRKTINKELSPFALMMSIPDPHGPNVVRPPYDTMFNDMTFKLPRTAVAAYNKNPALPGWAAIHTDLDKADELIEEVENDEKWQTMMRNYFGMVKLLDDKVGELMEFLKTSGLYNDTVVVFTRCDQSIIHIHLNAIIIINLTLLIVLLVLK